MARLLGRTANLLRQAGYCTALPSLMRREANRAAHPKNRSPISELLSLWGVLYGVHSGPGRMHVWQCL